MATQFTYPGVYIREFAPGPPIQGAGTSVAAFIGPTATGDVNTPTKIASFDEFKQQFGDQPLKGFFLWYAVRGFFENGGKVCYIVRASNGAYSLGTANDRAGNPLFQVRALQPGTQNFIVAVTRAPLLQNAQLYAPSATATTVTVRQVTLKAGEGEQFRPGDVIQLQNYVQPVQIARITSDVLQLTADLNPVPNKGTVRLADILKGATSVRLQANPSPIPRGTLVPGTVLTFFLKTKPIESHVVDSVQAEGGTQPTYRVTFRDALGTGFELVSNDPKDPNHPVATVESEEFKFDVTGTLSVYDNLATDPAHPRYYVDMINNATDGLVRVDPVEPPSPDVVPDSLPWVDPKNNKNLITLAGGAVEDLTSLTDNNFTDALDTLQQVNDVNLISIPDAVTLSTKQAPQPTVVQQAIIAHCEQLADRFAVLDSYPGLPLFGDKGVEGLQRPGLDSTRGYAALYYPWIRVPPLGAGAPILVPPSGHVCGIMARSDNARGVHKAPANEIVNGALDVERTMSEVEHGILNLEGIDVIRRFHTGSRPMLFGARTTATDTNWQYVNIRRLFLFLEKSIQNGIRWAVFEPNNTALWEKLKRTITDFLTSVWRDGALFGETADKAFYVRIDEALNPDSERALGRLHIEIGVRPSYPAEFIIVRIGIWYGGSQVTEG